MEYSDSEFYIALEAGMTPQKAHGILKRLADENDTLRKEIERDAKAGFESVGVYIGEELAPSEVILPPAAEIRRALRMFSPEEEWVEGGKVRFQLQPFGPFTPGDQPFKATLMLVAKANQSGG
jgi:hypothetical protein